MTAQREYQAFRLSSLMWIPTSTVFGLALIHLNVGEQNVVTSLVIFQIVIFVFQSLVWFTYYRKSIFKLPDIFKYSSQPTVAAYFFCLIAFVLSLSGLLFLIVSPNGLSQDIQGDFQTQLRGLSAQATAFAFVMLYFFEILMLSPSILSEKEI